MSIIEDSVKVRNLHRQYNVQKKKQIETAKHSQATQSRYGNRSTLTKFI